MNVSEKIIQTAIEDKMLNALAFDLKCKQIYVNSICYNYTPQKLAKDTGFSVNSVKKYIKWLSEQKIGYHDRYSYRTNVPMIYILKGHLHFSRIQPKNHITHINIKGKSFKEIKYLLYGTLIRAKVNAQRKSIRTKRQDERILKHPQRKDKVRHEKLRKKDCEIVIGEYVTLGVRRICKDLNIGIETVYQIVDYLKQQKIAFTFQGKKFLVRKNNLLDRISQKYSDIDYFKQKYQHCGVSFLDGGVLVSPALTWCFKKDCF